METVIRQVIADSGGAIPFSEFMHLALYGPQGGYYMRSESPFGAAGDFVTAPTLGKLFASCVAEQFIELKDTLNIDTIVELGAGNGALASGVMAALEQKQSLPENYCIHEISPARIAEQKDFIRKNANSICNRFVWVDRTHDFPQNAFILANEVLDAMPVERVQVRDQKLYRSFVAFNGSWQENFELATPEFQADVESSLDRVDWRTLPDGYTTEINLGLKSWLESLVQQLDRVVLLFIDYGFGEPGYFLPDRSAGTLMCHRKHAAHGAFFDQIGKTDITAHVNFTHLAMAAEAVGLSLSGYTTQSECLLALGALDKAEQSDIAGNPRISHELQTLIMPQEMGELFKVMGLSKNCDDHLRSFKGKSYLYQL